MKVVNFPYNDRRYLTYIVYTVTLVTLGGCAFVDALEPFITVYIRESYMYSSIVRLPDLHRTVSKTYTLENMDGAGNSFSLVRLTLMSINGVMHAQ